MFNRQTVYVYITGNEKHALDYFIALFDGFKLGSKYLHT